jgi:hypothetical protein
MSTGNGSCGQGAAPTTADCTMIMDSADFISMFKVFILFCRPIIAILGQIETNRRFHGWQIENSG